MRCLVVGCGLTGTVVARELAERGAQVEIWERRRHIGGNMYDYVDAHGFLVQKYGPHAFHTAKKELFEYICRFEQWQEYRLACGAVWDGRYTPTPFNFTTIDTFYQLPAGRGGAAEREAGRGICRAGDRHSGGGVGAPGSEGPGLCGVFV